MNEVMKASSAPPIAPHICSGSIPRLAQSNLPASHSVPPFYLPITQTIPLHSPNNGSEPMDSKDSPLTNDYNPDGPAPGSIAAFMHLWQPKIIHGIRYGGWAGAWLVILFLLFLAYGNLPNRWYHVLYMYSGSMAPAIEPGDLIIITPPTKVLEPGMILTMRVDGKLVTHRLLGISSDGLLITKGDANNALDNWDQGELEIGGIVRGHIPYLGYLTRISQVFAPDASGGWFTDAHQIKLDASSGSWVIEPTATPPGRSGTSITASLTAEGMCIPSSVILPEGAGTELEKCEDLPLGEPGAIDTLEALNVYGQVCVTNTGSVPTQDLKVQFQMQFKPEGRPFEDLPDSLFEFIPTEQLASEAARCYAYRIGFQPVDGVEKYKLVSSVTITNHSGYLPGSPHCKGPDPCPIGPGPGVDLNVDPDWQLDSDISTYDNGEEILLLQTPTITETPPLTIIEVTPIPTNDPTTLVPLPTEIIELPTEVPPIYIPSDETLPPTEIPPIFIPTDSPTEPPIEEEPVAPVIEDTPLP